MQLCRVIQVTQPAHLLLGLGLCIKEPASDRRASWPLRLGGTAQAAAYSNCGCHGQMLLLVLLCAAAAACACRCARCAPVPSGGSIQHASRHLNGSNLVIKAVQRGRSVCNAARGPVQFGGATPLLDPAAAWTHRHLYHSYFLYTAVGGVIALCRSRRMHRLYRTRRGMWGNYKLKYASLQRSDAPGLSMFGRTRLAMRCAHCCAAAAAAAPAGYDWAVGSGGRTQGRN